MRTLVVIFSAIGLVLLNGCKQETDAHAMLENPQTRSEILKAIAENHDYMTEFIDTMHSSEHAMQMMQGNKEMMKGEGMHMMMKKDSATMMNMMHSMMGNMESRHSMMSEMMKDGAMMGSMMQMMHEKGMISEDCMQSSMKMMDDKKSEKTEEGHSSHH